MHECSSCEQIFVNPNGDSTTSQELENGKSVICQDWLFFNHAELVFWAFDIRKFTIKTWKLVLLSE